jgi:hypothetical protein
MYVTGWRKRYQFLVLRQQLIAAAVLSCVGFAPTQSYSECTANQENCVALELSALGKPGSIVLLDFSLLRCAWRAVRRSRERADFWLWLWRYRRKRRPILIEAIHKLVAHAELRVLRNPKALKQFLAHIVRTN